MNEQNPKSPGVGLLDEEGICMLSLDGGGVRGLSSLYVLKRIMDGHNAERKRLGRSAQKPADIFDLIGGTTYNDLIKVVFNEKARVHQSKFSLLGQTQARFDSGGLRAAIEKTLKDRGLSPTDNMVNSREPDCKIFVCATSKLDAAVCRFRSYSSHKSSVSTTICQAARATSAATTFFNPVSIEGMKFVDGALGANNPVDQVEEEAMEIWCPATGNLQPLVKCFISIGTGRLPTYNIDDRVDKFIGALAKMATDAEKVAEASIKRWRQHFEQGRYFRFNVDHGLQTVGMKEYRKKREIQAATDRYLDSQVQSFWVQRCVENLILKKRSTRPDFELLITPQQDFVTSSPSPQGPESSQENQSKQPTSWETKSPPQPCYSVPTKLPPSSIDRPNYLRKLQAAFPQDQHQRVALAGLPGSGKTQIAIQFAEWVHSSYPKYSIFWLSADNFEESYSRIAQKLDLFRRYEYESKTTDARVLFHRYLSSERLGRWFLIIDDADIDNGSSSPSAQSKSVFSDLPHTEEGNILFITHSMRAATAAVGNQVNKVIEVSGLEIPDAISILRHSLFNKGLLVDEDIVKELLSELNGLPLSIQLAARYLNNHSHLTIAKFLELLRSPGQDAFPFVSQSTDGTSEGTDYEDSILKNAMKCFEAIQKLNPRAARLLEFISQTGPSSIPRTILAGTGIKGGKAELEESIGILCSFFLLAPRQGGSIFDMPTIIHLCIRVWAKQKKASKGLTETVTKRLNELMPPVDWSKRLTWKTYQAHTIRVLNNCQDLDLRYDDRFQLMCKVGSWLVRQRNSTLAIPWLQQAAEWVKKSSFKHSKRRLRIELDLAEAYAETGQSAKAIQLSEKALPFQGKHIPRDESSLLAVSCVLAKSYRFNGVPKHEIDRLEKLRRAGTKRSTMDKLILLGELGKCYNYAREYEKAAESLEMGIDAAESKIAKDDPILIAVKNHLAYSYEHKGERKKCISLLEETLPIQQQVLGKAHFDTLKIQVSLIEQYLKIKELTKVISLLEDLVPIQRKTIGQVHKRTMSSENSLAESYLQNRNVYTALKLYEHMVSVRQKNLGSGDEQRKWAEARYEKCIETWKWT
ncbi:related to calcium-independent phospholipase A2 [Fusarium fujikuroi]|nr:related to calcium-independent phospholipase A2 [Fusarium fujikuroi]